MSQEKVEMQPSYSADGMHTDAVKVTFRHTHYTDYQRNEVCEPIVREVFYPITDGGYVYFPLMCAVCHAEMQVIKREVV